MHPISLLEAAWNARLQHFGRNVYLYAPLYLSSYCVNDCLYCNFRSSNPRLVRRKLSVDQATAEAKAIADKGIHRVTLVTGEMPWDVVGHDILEIVRRLKAEGRFTFISGNFGSLPSYAFEELAQAGLDSYQIFQETYDEETYLKVHPRGPKRDFFLRLKTPFRLLEAGIPSVGLGVLVGLAPMDGEVAALEAHMQELELRFPGRMALLNLPRICPAPGATIQTPPFPVDDDTFLHLLAKLRVSYPHIGISLTTREKPEFRDRALRAGITHLSVESRTTVGGYAEATREDDGQFLLGDHRRVPEILEVIQEKELSAVTLSELLQDPHRIAETSIPLG